MQTAVKGLKPIPEENYELFESLWRCLKKAILLGG
jgi:hypothetical protein